MAHPSLLSMHPLTVCVYVRVVKEGGPRQRTPLVECAGSAFVSSAYHISFEYVSDTWYKLCKHSRATSVDGCLACCDVDSSRRAVSGLSR